MNVKSEISRILELLNMVENITLQQQQQHRHILTQIIYRAMIHEYTEYKISEIEYILDQ